MTETVLLASAIGLGLALAGAFLLEYLDDTIKTPDDVDKELPDIVKALKARGSL